MPRNPPPDVIALERTDEPTWTLPLMPTIPMPAIDASSSIVEPETVIASPQDAEPGAQAGNDPDPSDSKVDVKSDASAQALEPQEPSQQQTVDQNAGAETARLEAEREEAARQAAAEEETQRQEAARQEAARAETARLEAERQKAARQAAAQQEVQRQELARQEAVRAETARLAAERQEAERQEAERQEAARQEAARAETARLEGEREEAARQAAAQQEAQRQEIKRQEEARREERLRAIGRQLDEEADRRAAASDAARERSTLPLSLSLARRVKLWGRYHANAELVRYAEAWARKIQSNAPAETVREIAQRPHTPPLVTVAIRSDGSVESVTIELSSGAAQVDEALRRIVESQRPYEAFQPELAREFDVIEIRRTWHFGSAVQLD